MPDEIRKQNSGTSSGSNPRKGAIPSKPGDYDGLRVTVFGMARSGTAAARLLASAGAHVFVSDGSDNDMLRKRAADLGGIPHELGGHTSRCLDGADLAIKSPGIPESAPVAARLRERGVPILGEVELAFHFSRTPWVAVTGSNGKSTTTAMTGAILEASGFRTAVAGNIGTPLAGIVEDYGPNDRIVAEISSFQLENVFRFEPAVAVLLNITPDHLDRHGDLAEYTRVKCRIFHRIADPARIVINAEDRRLVSAAPAGASMFSGSGLPSGRRGVGFSGGKMVSTLQPAREEVLMAEAILPGAPGPHNLANAAAAACAAVVAGASPSSTGGALAAFRSLPHRLELVERRGGVAWYNDSKATNVDSVTQALKSFESGIIWLAGGRDKDGDFAALAPLLANRVRKLLAFGEAAEKIIASVGDAVPTSRYFDLKDALAAAREIASPGDTILLSPGCTSFDQYADFEERGEHFRKLVRRQADGDTRTGGDR